MPRITFTQDVTLEAEPQGTGPHYRRGYSPDVPEAEARKWIGKGVAVLGVVEFAKVTEKEPEAKSDEALSIPVFKPRRHRR